MYNHHALYRHAGQGAAYGAGQAATGASGTWSPERHRRQVDVRRWLLTTRDAATAARR